MFSLSFFHQVLKDPDITELPEYLFFSIQRSDEDQVFQCVGKKDNNLYHSDLFLSYDFYHPISYIIPSSVEDAGTSLNNAYYYDLENFNLLNINLTKPPSGDNFIIKGFFDFSSGYLSFNSTAKLFYNDVELTDKFINILSIVNNKGGDGLSDLRASPRV